MKDANCIFCKIAGGEIPSATIYEDDTFRVILDLNPAAKGHSLILPKSHAANIHDLPDEYKFSDEMIKESRDYFINGDHLTVLAIDADMVVGCASMSFIRMMPTFSHPTGIRAHLMNVYTTAL